MGETVASEPPHNITSASSRWIVLKASPIACELEAQAETVEKLGPLKPYRMDIWPGAMSVIIIGIKNGLIRRGPRSMSVRDCCSKVCIPPIPELTITPIRSLSSLSKSMPECFTAFPAATTANCVNRSILRLSLRSMNSSGEKSLISPANLVVKSAVSKPVIVSIPFLPASKFCQNSCTS